MVGIFLDVSTAPVSGCTPDWLGASKNNCSEERGEAATLCTLCHWRCLCSTQIQHITFDQTAVQHTGTDFYYGVARICSQPLSTCQNIIITLAGSYSNQHFEVVHYELSPAARARHQDSRSSVFYGVHSGQRRPGPGPSAAQPEIII